MDNTTICWVDLSAGQQKPSRVFGTISLKYHCYYLKPNDLLFSEIEKIQPTVLVFAYDSPSSECLSLLQKTKSNYPSIPILMVTKTHSEALAIWALRTRVWDYFVEPVSFTDFDDAIIRVSGLKEKNKQRKRETVTRINSSPSFRNKSASKQLILKAEAYIQKNYQKDLTAAGVAEQVGMSSSHFSRHFNSFTGESFCNYLWSIRFDKAKSMLIDPEVSITSVCYEIGCTIPPILQKNFETMELISPSEFQAQLKRTAS